MLKRHQVLLNDWLAESIKYVSERYDISFSEVIRISLCLLMGQGVSIAYPKFKFAITEKDIANITQSRIKKKPLTSVELHTFFSKVYFEARKALEYLEAQEKKQKTEVKSFVKK